MARPLTRRNRSQPKRDALLKAAVEVVAEQGVAGVTHRAVTERAGVPLATASYYFSSIGELISEALHEFARERAKEMEVAPTEAPTANEVGALFTDRFMDVTTLQRLAFFEILVSSARSPELAEPARHALAAYHNAARAALTSLNAPDSPENARAFVALGLGYGLLRMVEPGADDGAQMLAALTDLLRGQSEVS